MHRIPFAAFRVEPATEIIARRAGDMMRRYRRSHKRIGFGDYLNVRHFPMFEHLQPPFAITGQRWEQ